MTTKAVHKSRKSDQSSVARQAAGSKSAAERASVATKIPNRKDPVASKQPAREGQVTKLALLLHLLNRPEGASIADMMQATKWQQHSVRGFLAGTVKKKMGLALTSAIAGGDVRRYRIAAPRRGR